MRGTILLLVLCFCGLSGWAQRVPLMDSFKPKQGIICYAHPTNAPSYVPPPAEFVEWRKNQSARTKTATFNVTYTGFTPQAETAFQFAVDIWSTLITSPVPINITAQWSALGSGVLGGANAGTYYRDFAGTQRHLIWHPVALAEKITRRELNDPANPDIVASFSSQANWHFDPNTLPASGAYDLVTVVLHEIGHGLGITKSYTVVGDNGQISSFFGLPVAYETFVVNSSDQGIIQSFTSPSTALKTQLTGGNLFFDSPLVKAANNSSKAQIFAPGTFAQGSSIAHLDETVFPSGNINALMTPFISPQEKNHNPGPISMAILNDIGWKSLLIEHTALANTEDVSSPYEVKCRILSDEPYDPASVKLRYKTESSPYITVAMTATSNPDEFSAMIPNTGSTVEYRYYITVTDAINRAFKRPGGLYLQGVDSVAQLHIFFEAGPDTKAPFINHEPQPFVNASDAQLEIEAIVSDNIGINQVSLDYLINNVAQAGLPMTLKTGTDSTYAATINFAPSTLQHGDVITYRIKAIDTSVAQNERESPSATDYYTLNVVALGVTQDSYSNDFNTPSADFFGNEFSVTTPSGFANGAIHSTHPYKDGTGNNSESNYVYQLRIPIKIQAQEAFIKFDEIVLVEPGNPGTVFGQVEFWDFVIVEGSKDGGVTWARFADGYDARANSVWETRYSSAITGNNSTAVGEPSLYRPRIIDMLAKGNFAANDEVVIRFRLFADELANGWGWSIDNLKIQVDDIPPTILHNHFNYRTGTVSTIDLSMNVSDGAGVNALSLEYKINGGTLQISNFVITPGVNQYAQTINFNPTLTSGALLEYRIRAKDNNMNEVFLPNTDFFKVPVINFSTPLDTYFSNFDTTNDDFVGNLFSISTPTGFNHGAVHSVHPYYNGFGLDKTSSFTYTLKKPIKISASNYFTTYDEIVIAEYNGNTFRDYMIMEGSKDGGATWLPFISEYSSNLSTTWTGAFNNKLSGTPSMYKPHFVDMISNGNFKAGDDVIIRFRMFATELVSGWGFALDNLSIQGAVTGLEETNQKMLSVSPNPVNEALSIRFSNDEKRPGRVALYNLQGQQVYGYSFKEDEQVDLTVSVQSWQNGLYLIKLNTGDKFITQKILKIE